MKSSPIMIGFSHFMVHWKMIFRNKIIFRRHSTCKSRTLYRQTLTTLTITFLIKFLLKVYQKLLSYKRFLHCPASATRILFDLWILNCVKSVKSQTSVSGNFVVSVHPKPHQLPRQNRTEVLNFEIFEIFWMWTYGNKTFSVYLRTTSI